MSPPSTVRVVTISASPDHRTCSGETIWTYSYDEGERGRRPARTVNRGLAYWSDGADDERIIVILPGYHLLALDASTGKLAWHYAHAPGETFDLDVVFDDNVVKEARKLGINVSEAANDGLRDAVRRRREERDRAAYVSQPESEDSGWDEAEALGEP